MTTTLAGVLTVKCPLNSLACRNSTKCYRQRWACDGIRDCPFADDELGCYQSSNRTVEKETSDTGGETPYSMELGFLIFVMAGGLLFLLFLWWLCNISVHKRGHRGHGCMEALVADLKDRTWKSDLYDPDEFSEENAHRSLRGEAIGEEGHHSASVMYNPSRSYRLAGPRSSRCSERLQDQLFMSVDEIGVLASPQRGPPSRPPLLHISRPPSYNSCLNSSGGGDSAATADSVVIIDVRRGNNVIDDVTDDVEKPERSGEEGSNDLLPSYDEVTREVVGPGGQLDRLPSYPPAYREVAGSE